MVAGAAVGGAGVVQTALAAFVAVNEHDGIGVALYFEIFLYRFKNLD